MQPSQVNEIKQQAIIEKAQDPNSAVSATAAKEAILSESKKAGAATYSVSPNATAAEKAAQIDASIPPDVKAATAALKGQKSVAGGTAAISDRDLMSKPAAKLPPPSTAGALKVGEVDESKGMAGGWTEEDEGYWKKAGWAPRFGDGKPADVDMNTTMLDHTTWLDDKIPDHLFGGEFCSALSPNADENRLVSQYWNHHLFLPSFMGGGSPWRWPRMGHLRHAVLWHILPHIDTSCSPQFPRRRAQRNVQGAIGN
jgi:hypothetical protein